MQQTLKEAFDRAGAGLHSGAQTRVRVLPAAAGEGRYFVRVDLSGEPQIPALASSAGETMLSTELKREGATVRTVEHLLAALAASGVDNARIEIDGPEVPLLDGSAREWTEAIARAGLISDSLERNELRVLTSPIAVFEGDAFVTAVPSSELCFTYGIDFAQYPAIAQQWATWYPDREPFADAIAPARTFGFADQIEQLRKLGLIKGGSLDNALVCDRNGWLNPPLRFDNEPARHKLLDLVGDLSLLGTFPRAHFLAYKASHSLHVRLAKAIQSQIA